VSDEQLTPSLAIMCLEISELSADALIQIIRLTKKKAKNEAAAFKRMATMPIMDAEEIHLNCCCNEDLQLHL
jgi:hypothetical protein